MSKKKKSVMPNLLIAIFTFLYAVVTLVTKIYERKQIVAFVDENHDIILEKSSKNQVDL